MELSELASLPEAMTPQEIKQRLDLVAVGQDLGLDLRLVDGRWLALCPFHDDHAPSFDVYPDGMRCGCRACGWDGDVFDLIQFYRGCDFAQAKTEAIFYLHQGLERDPVPIEDRPVRDFGTETAQAVERGFGTLGLLLMERQIRVPATWIAENFMVGEAEDGGVFIPHVGLKGDIQAAKIRRPPEWIQMAPKGSSLHEMYGSHRDKGQNRVVLVEGESDTWSTAWALRDRADRTLVLGLPSGAMAAPRPDWVERLKNCQVVICFDADTAGRTSARRWCMALPQALVTRLPENTDATSAGEAALLGALRRAISPSYPHTSLAIEDDGIYRKTMVGRGDNKEEKTEHLADWVPGVESVVLLSGQTLYRMQVNGLGRMEDVGSNELSGARKLREWSSARALSWKGTDRDTQELLQLLEHQSIFSPRLQGTTVAGLHDGRFVLPGDDIIGRPGWTYTPPVNDVDMQKELTLGAGQWDRGVPLSLCELHIPAVTTPLIGWIAAAPLRSLFEQFPFFAVTGGSGFGKTTLLETILETFGYCSKINLTVSSPFGVESYVSSTNAFPVWVDEFRKGGRPDTRQRFEQLLRDAWNAHPSVKGGQGTNFQAIHTITPHAPLLISGEDNPMEVALSERAVRVPLPRDGKSSAVLKEVLRSQRLGFGRSYLAWLQALLREELLPAPPHVVEGRQAHSNAIVRWGWNLFREFSETTCEIELPELDLSLVDAGREQERNEMPPYLAAVVDAVGQIDRDTVLLAQVDGEDVLCRPIALCHWADAKYGLPGGSRAFQDWLRASYPGSDTTRYMGQRMFRIKGLAKEQELV